MGKVLLNISILNKNYCIFEREKGAKLNASFYDKKAKAFGFVTNEKELRILNEVIRMLNRKYVRRKNIVFNDENFIRYVNKYTGMSYFARMENGTILSCPYLDYKELYNEYNSKQVFCISRRSNTRNSKSSYDDYSSNFDRYLYHELWDDPIPRKSYKGNRNGGIVKKVALSIAGVAVFALITFGGYQVLSTGSFPEIESSESIIEELEQSGISLKDLDTKADTEAEKNLKAKYDNIAEQLRAAGLADWEVAVELDIISIIDEDKDNISFYYDSDKEKVVYVYDNIQKRESKSGREDIQVSEDIERIIEAVNSNTNLSETQKRHIIDTYIPIWCKNEKYLNIYELINRYSILETEFDFTEGGKYLEETQSYNPHEHIAGTYSHTGILAQCEEDLGKTYQSKITIYDSPSFEDTLESESATSTFDHESNHINGNLDYYSATLLNEGYTQLSQANRSNRYKTESAMAMLFIETFGPDAFKEGFYGFDLQTVLTNQIVSITKQDPNVVDKELYGLLQDTEDVLYAAGKDENYQKNSEIMEQFESVFRKLGAYHEIITGREMEDNQAANIMKDYITGSRSSSLYGKDSENIESISLDYNVDNGNLEVELGVLHGDIPYSVSALESQIIAERCYKTKNSFN